MKRWEDFRVEMRDAEDNVLAIVVNTNGLSWKLYAEYRPKGGPTSYDSNPWWYTSKVRALKGAEEKIQEAVAKGWPEPQGNGDSARLEDELCTKCGGEGEVERNGEWVYCECAAPPPPEE